MNLRHTGTLVLAFSLSASVFAAGPSSVTANGTAMPVKSAVAVWDAKGSNLKLFLLPIQPTPAEVALLQKDDTLWMGAMASPDAKKWATWVPHAYLDLGWFSAADVNDLSKASCHLFQVDIVGKANNSFFDCDRDALKGVLTGKIKPGETITLAAKGSGKNGDNSYAWDLSVSAKVLPAVAGGHYR